MTKLRRRLRETGVFDFGVGLDKGDAGKCTCSMFAVGVRRVRVHVRGEEHRRSQQDGGSLSQRRLLGELEPLQKTFQNPSLQRNTLSQTHLVVQEARKRN